MQICSDVKGESGLAAKNVRVWRYLQMSYRLGVTIRA